MRGVVGQDTVGLTLEVTEGLEHRASEAMDLAAAVMEEEEATEQVTRIPSLIQQVLTQKAIRYIY